MILKNIICFIAGGVTGAGITYFFVKRSVENAAEAEINAIRELYNKKEPEQKETEEQETALPKIDPGDNKIVEDILNRQGYRTPYGSYFNGKNESKSEPVKHIRLIHPDELEQIEEYSLVTMEYYSKNDILAYSTTGPRIQEDIVHNREALIGDEALKNFGLYQKDYIHVINDTRQAYYEINLVDEEFETDDD